MNNMDVVCIWKVLTGLDVICKESHGFQSYLWQFVHMLLTSRKQSCLSSLCCFSLYNMLDIL